MASISERLQYILSFDTRQAVGALQQVGKAGEDALDDTRSRADRASSGLMKYGAAAMATAGVAGMALWKIAQSASEVEESSNAVNVTFGEQAAAIHEIGKTSAQSMGLSTSAFNQAAVGFASFGERVAGTGGDVAKVTTDMMVRASDFASVMNMDVGRAMNVFRSAMAGETESIKQFGIDMSSATVEAYAYANGIAEQGKKLDATQQAMARYGLLMQSTEQMAGDFVNTSGSLANSQRILAADIENLKANIGSGLLPVFGGLISAATDVTGVFADLGPEMQKTIGGIAGFGTATLGALGALSFLIGAAIKAKQNFGAVAQGFTNMGRAAKGATLAMGAVGLILTAATAIYIGYKKKQEEVAEAARKMAEAIRAQLDVLIEERDLLEELSTASGRAAAGKDLYTASVVESGAVTEEEIKLLGQYGTNLDKIYDMTLEGVGAVEQDIASRLRREGVAAGEAATLANAIMLEGTMGEVKLRQLDLSGNLLDAILAERDAYNALSTVQQQGTLDTLNEIAGRDAAGTVLVSQATRAIALRDGLTSLNYETYNAAQLQEVLLEVGRRQEEGFINEAAAVDRSTNRMAAHGYELGEGADAAARNAEAAEANAEAWQEWADYVEEATQQAQDDFEATVNAAQEWADNIRGSIDSGAQSFIDMEVTAETTAASFLEQFKLRNTALIAHEGQLRTMRETTLETMVQSGKITSDQADEFIGYMAAKGESVTGLVTDMNESPELIEGIVGEWVTSVENSGDGMVAGLDVVAPGLEDKMITAKSRFNVQLTLIKSRAQIGGREIGDTLPDGIEQGLVDGSSDLYAAGRAMINELLAEMRTTAESESPSRLFARELGGPLVQGVAVGIDADAHLVTEAMDTAIMDAADGAPGSLLFKDDVGRPISEGVAEGVQEDGAKIGDELEKAIEDAAERAVEAAEELVEETQEVLDGLWDAIDDRIDARDLNESVDDAVEGVEEAADAVAAAQAELDRLTAQGSTPDYERIQEAQDALTAAKDKTADAIERESDAARAAKRAQEDLAAAQADGKTTARQLEDAIERVSDSQTALEDATQAVTDTQREQIEAQGELNEALNTPAVTAEELKEAEEDLQKAKEDHEKAIRQQEEAYRKLAEAKVDMLDGTPEEIAAWEDIARNAGLTELEIRDLAAAYRDLAAAKVEAGVSGAAISADSARAQRVRDDFAFAVDAGWISEEFLDQLSNMSPSQQLGAMATKLNDIQRYFGEPEVAYHSGGVVRGAAGANVPIMAQAGERVMSRAEVAESMTAAEMARAVSDGMVAGWRRVQQLERAR